MKKKIFIIGSSGFVGKNLTQLLADEFDIIASSRDPEITGTGIVYFDLTDTDSYRNILNSAIDILINCAGYGVVKTEKDVGSIYNINYLATTSFYDFLSKQMPWVHLIHLGTAFEYDLTITAIDEQSSTLPRTHYGISNLMASKYLVEKNIIDSYQIIRPFSMFGAYEDSSKIIPFLILSQKEKRNIQLSSGFQKRDYLFVEDLASYIKSTLLNLKDRLFPAVVNVGSGFSISIRSLALLLVPTLPYYDPELWQWGALALRENEGDEFYNKSDLAKKNGLMITQIQSALKRTVNYYWNL